MNKERKRRGWRRRVEKIKEGEEDERWEIVKNESEESERERERENVRYKEKDDG